jgi:hypothetical protein
MRTQAFLILEELWMVALNLSESKVKQTAAHARLSHFDDVVLLVKENVEQDLPGFGNFTIPERLLVQIGIALIRLVSLTCDAEMSNMDAVSTQAANFCSQIWGFMDDFIVILNDAVKGEQPDDDWMPKFITTLHPLYTAHESATLVLAVADYLSSGAVWVNPDVKPIMVHMKNFAKRLRNLISQKTRMVSRWINGPRLDWVLEKIKSENPSKDELPSENGTELDEEAFERANGYKRALLPDAPQTMGELLTECVSPDFLESWAGELVESWRESVMGLACLKSDEPAPEEGSV